MEDTHPLKKLREHLDMTQDQLAEQVGWSRSFVAQVENGQSNLGRDSILVLFEKYPKQLAKLGIDAVDMLRGLEPAA